MEFLKKYAQILKLYGFFGRNFWSRWFRLMSFSFGIIYGAAASGWVGWALAQLEFGSSVNSITTRGADYVHHITASPPGFENPAASPISII